MKKLPLIPSVAFVFGLIVIIAVSAGVANRIALASEHDFDVLVSLSPDRSGEVALGGETVSGDIFVFTSPDDGVDSVSFSIDGKHERTESKAPFDLAGTVSGSGPDRDAKPFDSTDLTEGLHTLMAEIEADGGTVVVEAEFNVDNVTEPVLPECEDLPSHSDLAAALLAARNEGNGGFNLDMWGTIVNRDGVVCGVAMTGADRGDQWPGSRVISAQKANTANAFSLPGLALSTANLFAPVQPAGSLFGLQHSNPVNTSVAYGGNAQWYGQDNDPMVGGKIGGVNVFGGGLPLYNAHGQLVGAVGVSGDSSCADHNIAWRTRNNLSLDYVPGGVSGDPERPDNIIFDMSDDDHGNPESASGFGHSNCIDPSNEMSIAGDLPPIRLVHVALSDFTNIPALSWAVTVVADMASNGTVVLDVTNINDGPPNIPHDMTIAKTDLAPGDLPLRNDATCIPPATTENVCGVDETQVEIVGRTSTLFPGDSESLALPLEAGNYVLFCSINAEGLSNRASHYFDGMFTGFTVQ